MDNFNSENNIAEEVTRQQTGFKLVTDNPAPQEAQPMQNTAGMPQQPYGQPDMNNMYGQPNMNQGIPGMPQQPYGQPDMNNMYGQPNMNTGMNMAMNGQPNMNTMYGQPNMNQMYGQPGAMPPQGGNTPKPKKVKKPLSKGAIGGIIGGGIALIALIVCAIIFLPKLFRSDKEVVVDAFEATFGVDTEAAEADDDGMTAFNEAFAENGGTRNVEITLNSIMGDTSVGGMYVKGESVADYQNKKLTSNIDMGTADGSLVNVILNADETYSYFILKDMIDGTFVLPNDNAFVELENSPIGEAMGLEGMTEIDLADYYFMGTGSDVTSATEIDGELVTLVEDTWDSITYEKQGKAKISVNGKKITAKEYYVTLEEKKIEELLVGFVDYVGDTALADTEALAASGVDAASMEAVITQLKNMVPQLISGDLLIKVYIVDDEIVKITCEDEVGLYGVDISYNFNLEISDDQAQGLFEVGVAEEKIGIKFDATNEDDVIEGRATVYGLEETIDINFEASEKDDKIAAYFDICVNGTAIVAVDINVTEKDDKFTGDVSVEVYDDYSGETYDVVASFEGSTTILEKGVSYKTDISSLKLLVNEEEMFDVSMSMTADNSKHTVDTDMVQGTQYDLITMTEDDLIGVIEDNEELLTTWLENFENNAGPFADLFSSTDYDVDYDEPDEPVSTVASVDAGTLCDGDREVKITGSIDGFKYYMTSDIGSYVSYETEAWSDITYTLYSDNTPDDLLKYFYVPDEEYVMEKELDQVMTVNGETIRYSYCLDNAWGDTMATYCMVKEIEPNLCLVVNAMIYVDDDIYTKEQIAEALDSKNYTIVK